MAAVIHLPWPPSKTSKNGSQGDFRGKARAGRGYKETCAWACVAQKVRPMSLDGDVPVLVTFCPPDNRRIDWDNISGRAKQGFDAVAEATHIDDSRWWPVTVRKGSIVKDGAVLVEIGAPQDTHYVPFMGQIS